MRYWAVLFSQDKEIAEQDKSVRRFDPRFYLSVRVSIFKWSRNIVGRRDIVKIIIREAVAKSAEQPGIQQASNQWPKSIALRNVRFSRIGSSANILLILSLISMLCKTILYFRYTGRILDKIDAVRYMLISAHKSFQGDKIKHVRRINTVIMLSQQLSNL